MPQRPNVEAADEILNLYFPVLDHGFVALVDYMGGDASVIRAARTSYGAGTKRSTEDRALARYLQRHRHTTPSEMTEIVVHMGLPIFVARQLVRHRTASLNEYSGRYSKMPMLFYRPDQEHLQLQSKTNKQGRAGVVDDGTFHRCESQWKSNEENAKSYYSNQLSYDVSRELARIDLPLSTYTYWYWKMDLHNLLHFLGLRLDSHAQYEIRAFSNVLAGIVQRIAPDTFEAWLEYEFCGERMSYTEMEMLRQMLVVSVPDQFPNAQQLVQMSTNKDLVSVMPGLSNREVGEFLKKFQPRTKPDFSLDLSTGKDASFFEEKILAAVPAEDLT